VSWPQPRRVRVLSDHIPTGGRRSSSPMVPCLDCGDLVPHGSRCGVCRRALERVRNAQPKRRGYRSPAYLAQPKEGLCWLCGKLILPDEGTRDHVVPLAVDPYSVLTRPAHRSCNSARGARSGE
jgi:5-methylcytosine-specific restriction endonuclease McrA